MLSNLVEMSGLEPPTPTLSGWCSNRLSYNPILSFSRDEWSRTTVSKPQFFSYQGGALTGWATIHRLVLTSLATLEDFAQTGYPTLSGKVFLKSGWNTYYLLPLIYNNFSTTKFLLQQNKSNLLLQFVANVIIYDIFFALILPKTN